MSERDMPDPDRGDHRFRSAVTRTLLWTVLALAGLAAGTPDAGAQPPIGREYEVKTGFIYHFLRFTRWPEEAFQHPGSPLMLCVVARRPEAGILTSLRNKMVSNRKIDVRLITESPAGRSSADPPSTSDAPIMPSGASSETPEQGETPGYSQCHALFVASDQMDFIQAAIERYRAPYVLILGEAPGAPRVGVMINFIIREDRLRFEVNPDAVAEAGLRLSSQLLMSASIYRPEKTAPSPDDKPGASPPDSATPGSSPPDSVPAELPPAELPADLPMDLIPLVPSSPPSPPESFLPGASPGNSSSPAASRDEQKSARPKKSAKTTP